MSKIRVPKSWLRKPDARDQVIQTLKDEAEVLRQKLEEARNKPPVTPDTANVKATLLFDKSTTSLKAAKRDVMFAISREIFPFVSFEVMEDQTGLLVQSALFANLTVLIPEAVSNDMKEEVK